MESPKVKRLTFADFQTFGEEPLVKALDAAKNFIERLTRLPFDDGMTLTLCGRSGIGKSFLTKIIFDELGVDAWLNISRVKVEIRNGHKMDRRAIKKDWRKVSDGFKEGDWSIVEALEEPLLVGLDDIGSDYDPRKIAVSKLDRILRSRSRKWTVVNTNLLLGQIATELDTRISSHMIRDGNVVVEMTGKDFALRD